MNLTKMTRALKQARIERGLTQKELAEAIGVAAATLCFWESGRRRPSFFSLTCWCNALGFTLGIIKVSDDDGSI